MPLQKQVVAADVIFHDDHVHGKFEHALIDKLLGFRMNAPADRRVRILVDGKTEQFDFELDDDAMAWRWGADHETVGNVALWTRDGATFEIKAYRDDGGGHHHAHDGDILSPMPGKIIAVEVALGQAVTKGQKLLTLEAMKMEHTLTAPFDGTVAELSATPGAQVQVEALLARIEAASAVETETRSP